MNKKIIGIFIVMLLITPITISGIEEKKDEMCKTETILFSNPILRKNGEYVSVDLTESTSSLIGSDKPKLPIVTKTYTFPFNTMITDIKVSFFNSEKQILTKPIIPAPEPQILYSTDKSTDINIKENTVTYNNLDIYPEQRSCFRVGAGLKDGQRMKFLTVHLYPVQYVPEDNMICYYDSATIDISYSSSENPVSFPDAYDLLILTPAEFTDELQPLVDYKNENNIPTIMVTLDDIPEKGVDQQEDIKYYIKDAIETWGITYVLIVGSGVKDEEKFPVRYAFCSPFLIPPYSIQYPCDLYYADIYDSINDFSSWNYDDDSKYFEYPTDLPSVDMYPDVYLGRLACNSEKEVVTVVNKIIDFMENNKMTNKILQIGGDSYIINDNIYEGEFQNEQVLKKLSGYTSTRLWASLGNLKKINIRKGFMDSVDFVDIATHGNPILFATYPPNNPNSMVPTGSIISPFPGFRTSDYDIFFFNNEKLPVIVYSCCLCSTFTDSSNCMGWKPISRSKGGGIATFGHTTSVMGIDGNQAVDRYAGWNEVKIFEEMYKNKILGISWCNCITEYINNFNIDGADLTVIPSFTLLGDPTLAIEDGKNIKTTSFSESVAWSDNFDSYNNMQMLDGTSDDGGWKCYLNNPGAGAYVVDDYALSSPHSLEINGSMNICHEFSEIRSGNLTFRDWVYIPSGSDFGEFYIALLSYYLPDHYLSLINSDSFYFQAIIKLDINNQIVTNKPKTDSLPLLFNQWVEIRIEIDFETDWINCFYNDELLMGQKWTTDWLNRDGFLNLACIRFSGYFDGDFSIYHDDMSIYHEGTGLEPDLQCEGDLSLTCKAGETVSDTFIIRNVGDPGSRLEWMIYNVPDYGSESWCLFDSFNGILTPEDGELTITATLTAPADVGDYSGVIKIHAIGDPSDLCEIPITLTVKKSREEQSKNSNWSDPFSYSITKNKEINTPLLQFLENHSLLFPMLRQMLKLS